MKKEVYIKREDFNKGNYQRFLIVSDIGGAHTYISIMGVRDKRTFKIIFKKTYETSQVKSVPELLNEALREAKAEYDIEVSRACIAVAGHMLPGRKEIKSSHYDLVVNVDDITSKTMLNTVLLLNDFEAIGYGIDLLDLENPYDVIQVPHSNGQLLNTKERSTCAVLGAGFGLGMSILFYDVKKYLHVPIASEGGHMDFAPAEHIEYELEDYLKESVVKDPNKQPDFERVLSGRGMENIYNFLRLKERDRINETLRIIDNLHGDAKLEEIERNYDKEPICKKTVDMFLKFYARAARNLSLMTQSYGGLFIGGGIALKLKEYFKLAHFIEEFEKNDRKSDILKAIPVYVIHNKDVGLYGCCNVAVNFYNIN